MPEKTPLVPEVWEHDPNHQQAEGQHLVRKDEQREESSGEERTASYTSLWYVVFLNHKDARLIITKKVL